MDPESDIAQPIQQAEEATKKLSHHEEDAVEDTEVAEDAEDAEDAETQSQSDIDLPPIVRFYRGDPDFKNRTLAEILTWSDSQLEFSHDYIQILFPLPEHSNFMLYPAPRLDERTVEMFKSDPSLRAEMRIALARMLKFFGFDFQIMDTNEGENGENGENGDSSGEKLSAIVPNPQRFPRAARNWMNSHNDLRITRIIRCLRCCGMDSEAREFYRALRVLYSNRVGYPRRIGDRTFMYWTRAARRDLRIPPDMSDAEAASILGETP